MVNVLKTTQHVLLWKVVVIYASINNLLEIILHVQMSSKHFPLLFQVRSHPIAVPLPGVVQFETNEKTHWRCVEFLLYMECSGCVQMDHRSSNSPTTPPCTTKHHNKATQPLIHNTNTTLWGAIDVQYTIDTCVHQYQHFVLSCQLRRHIHPHSGYSDVFVR